MAKSHSGKILIIDDTQENIALLLVGNHPDGGVISCFIIPNQQND